MSEDYKKIALEDVKKGQRVRIVGRHRVYTATFEGVVVRKVPDYEAIEIGEKGSEVTIHLAPGPGADFDILLLEDAPKPKVVRTETVTITHYDDGTKTETPVNKVWVPTSLKTMEQFEEYEGYLRKYVLKDRTGRYWENRHGQWRWAFGSLLHGITWHTPTTPEPFEDSLPMTVVDNVGD